jgi:hypothetical protein
VVAEAESGVAAQGDGGGVTISLGGGLVAATVMKLKLWFWVVRVELRR